MDPAEQIWAGHKAMTNHDGKAEYDNHVMQQIGQGNITTQEESNSGGSHTLTGKRMWLPLQPVLAVLRSQGLDKVN